MRLAADMESAIISMDDRKNEMCIGMGQTVGKKLGHAKSCRWAVIGIKLQSNLSTVNYIL